MIKLNDRKKKQLYTNVKSNIVTHLSHMKDDLGKSVKDDKCFNEAMLQAYRIKYRVMEHYARYVHQIADIIGDNMVLALDPIECINMFESEVADIFKAFRRSYDSNNKMDTVTYARILHILLYSEFVHYAEMFYEDIPMYELTKLQNAKIKEIVPCAEDVVSTMDQIAREFPISKRYATNLAKDFIKRVLSRIVVKEG